MGRYLKVMREQESTLKSYNGHDDLSGFVCLDGQEIETNYIFKGKHYIL